MSFISILSLFLFCIYQNVVNAAAFPNNLAPYHPPTEASHIKDRYIIRLRPDHTLKAHFARIGLDLSALPQGCFGYIHAINAYYAQLDNAQVHSFIRTDPGVKYVRHDVQGRPFNDTISDADPVEDSVNSGLFRRWEKATSELEQPYYVPMTTKKYPGEVPLEDRAVG